MWDGIISSITFFELEIGSHSFKFTISRRKGEFIYSFIVNLKGYKKKKNA